MDPKTDREWADVVNAWRADAEKRRKRNEEIAKRNLAKEVRHERV